MYVIYTYVGYVVCHNDCDVETKSNGVSYYNVFIRE